MSQAKSKKHVTFSQLRVAYAKKRDLEVSVASKRLRAKIRGAYGKSDVITKWLDSADKTNRDGNRYPDASPTVAKEILSL